ncbi:MAG: adenosylmethionine decarboxylase [Alphaproteobacteria bacterium]|nr:adenosylmethionine decarboxylase [Alphaproteobacteria bacterium]
MSAPQPKHTPPLPHVPGKHILLDLWADAELDDASHIETTVRAAIDACGATLLNLYVHRFPGNGGVTALAALAESHMSFHSWPEFGYAAIDIYTCGDTPIEKAVEVFQKSFRGGKIKTRSIDRHVY